MTNDIARGLSAPVAYAERMKTLYGSANPTPSDDQEHFKIPLVGEEESGSIKSPVRCLWALFGPALKRYSSFSGIGWRKPDLINCWTPSCPYRWGQPIDWRYGASVSDTR